MHVAEGNPQTHCALSANVHKLKLLVQSVWEHEAEPVSWGSAALGNQTGFKKITSQELRVYYHNCLVMVTI